MLPTQESMTILKTIANPTRFAILSILERTTVDICVNEIADKIGISQSLTSHQLAYLEVRGVIKSVRMGRNKCYMLSDTPIAKKIIQLTKLFR